MSNKLLRRRVRHRIRELLRGIVKRGQHERVHEVREKHSDYETPTERSSTVFRNVPYDGMYC